MNDRYPIRPLHPNDLHNAHSLNMDIGTDKMGAQIMAPKMLHISLLVEGLSRPAANVLKQQCLSIGCEAAVERHVVLGGEGTTSAIVSGDLRHFRLLQKKLCGQPWGLAVLGEHLQEAAEKLAQPQTPILRWRNKTIELTKPAVVAVLNLTPDSFSDGGSYPSVDAARERAQQCEREGAAALELGGESTRPGAATVSVAEELERVLPALEVVRANTELPLIVDTRKVEVAKAALDAGADAINDIAALGDEAMRKVIAEAQAGAVLMHMQGEPSTMQQNPHYDDVVGEVVRFLKQATEVAISDGVAADAIVVDVGIGFGKSLQHNLELLRNLEALTLLGYAVMVGISRKRMIGELTTREKPQDRLWGTMGGVLAAAARGAHLLRVHDVAPVVEALQVFDAIDSYQA